MLLIVVYGKVIIFKVRFILQRIRQNFIYKNALRYPPVRRGDKITNRALQCGCRIVRFTYNYLKLIGCAADTSVIVKYIDMAMVTKTE